jgi:hypothetical protein
MQVKQTKLKIMNNRPSLNPILNQTLEFIGLGIATSGFIIGIHLVIENLKESSDKAVFDFAVRNHLGGSLLPVARDLMEFTREQTALHLWHGAMIGVAVSTMVMLLVILFLTTGKYYIDRSEYIDLLDKASRWEYHVNLNLENPKQDHEQNSKSKFDSHTHH